MHIVTCVYADVNECVFTRIYSMANKSQTTLGRWEGRVRHSESYTSHILISYRETAIDDVYEKKRKQNKNPGKAFYLEICK